MQQDAVVFACRRRRRIPSTPLLVLAALLVAGNSFRWGLAAASCDRSVLHGGGGGGATGKQLASAVGVGLRSALTASSLLRHGRDAAERSPANRASTTLFFDPYQSGDAALCEENSSWRPLDPYSSSVELPESVADHDSSDETLRTRADWFGHGATSSAGAICRRGRRGGSRLAVARDEAEGWDPELSSALALPSVGSAYPGPAVATAFTSTSTASSSPSAPTSAPHPPAGGATGERGGSIAAAAVVVARPLVFWENMVCGAISRSVAQTIMHPANTMKTMLQNRRGDVGPSLADLVRPDQFRRLTVGAGANFLLSVPHGAVNFAVLEFVRKRLADVVASTPVLSDNANKLGPGLDFLSSAISTITCSVVSTPQMMITDNIMAGNFPNLPSAVVGLARQRGVLGFYAGWWPGLVGKIPSYALTWTFFQQLKDVRNRVVPDRPATNVENSIMGCLASATTVCIMIPMDTIKTRLVTQAGTAASNVVPYKGIVDCAVRVAREEGIATFYRGLPPRLISVVPMIGIQFGVYEAMKRAMLRRQAGGGAAKAVPSQTKKAALADVGVEVTEEYGRDQVLEEAMMEVAASPEHPYPAPHFLKRVYDKSTKKVQKEIRNAQRRFGK